MCTMIHVNEDKRFLNSKYNVYWLFYTVQCPLSSRTIRSYNWYWVVASVSVPKASYDLWSADRISLMVIKFKNFPILQIVPEPLMLRADVVNLLSGLGPRWTNDRTDDIRRFNRRLTTEKNHFWNDHETFLKMAAGLDQWSSIISVSEKHV